MSVTITSFPRTSVSGASPWSPRYFALHDTKVEVQTPFVKQRAVLAVSTAWAGALVQPIGVGASPGPLHQPLPDLQRQQAVCRRVRPSQRQSWPAREAPGLDQN